MEPLKAVVPPVAMNPGGTAVGFLLSGTALWLLQSGDAGAIGDRMSLWASGMERVGLAPILLLKQGSHAARWTYATYGFEPLDLAGEHEVGAEDPRLLVAPLRQLRAAQPAGEAEVVADERAGAGLSAGGVLASSDMPQEAQEFLAYATGPEGQRALVESGSMEYAVGTGTESDPALPALEELEAPAVDVSSLNSDRVIALMTDVGIL